jgi:hypothetical protein
VDEPDANTHETKLKSNRQAAREADEIIEPSSSNSHETQSKRSMFVSMAKNMMYGLLVLFVQTCVSKCFVQTS